MIATKGQRKRLRREARKNRPVLPPRQIAPDTVQGRAFDAEGRPFPVVAVRGGWVDRDVYLFGLPLDNILPASVVVEMTT